MFDTVFIAVCAGVLFLVIVIGGGSSYAMNMKHEAERVELRKAEEEAKQAALNAEFGRLCVEAALARAHEHVADKDEQFAYAARAYGEMKLEDALKLAESKAEADAMAFETIQHGSKRTMLESMFWLNKIRKMLIKATTPMASCTQSGSYVSVPGLSKAELHELSKITEEILKTNREGVDLCKTKILQRAIFSGTYRLMKTVVNVQDYVEMEYGDMENVRIFVSEDLPEFIWLDMFLFKMVLSNAFNNAVVHGETNGSIKFLLDVRGGLLSMSVVNKPGAKHAQNRALQTKDGNHTTSKLLHLLVGNSESTFLGLKEISIVSKLMSAETYLLFEADEVVFKLELALEEAESASVPDTDEYLPAGSIVIAADDDPGPRLQYQDMIQVLGSAVDQSSSVVLGEKYADVVGIVQRVLHASSQVADPLAVVCIFDQNLEFKEGRIFGTEITTELRDVGFKGLIFIRSAMDDFYSVEKFRKAGATANITKDSHVTQIIDEVKQHYQIARASTTVLQACTEEAQPQAFKTVI